MKKKLIFVFFIALLCVANNSLVQAETCILNVRTTNLPPLYFQNDLGKWTGLTVDLAKVLLNEAGCKGRFKAIPWARSLYLMKAGQIDMMMNLSMTDERKKFIYFLGPQIDETARLIIRKEIDVKIQSLDDFKKLPGRIGLQRGMYLGETFEKKLKNDPTFKDKFEITHSSELDIKKLLYGRIIGVIDMVYGGVLKTQQYRNLKEFKVLPFIIHKNLVYFGFSKKSVSKELLGKLQKAYAKAKSEGKFVQVIDRYK